MKNKVVALLAVFTVVIGGLAINNGLTMLKNGVSNYALEGSGTSQDPFIIKTQDDFADIDNKGNTVYYKLANDITLTKNHNILTSRANLDGDGKKIIINSGALVQRSNTESSCTSNYSIIQFFAGQISNATIEWDIANTYSIQGSSCISMQFGFMASTGTEAIIRNVNVNARNANFDINALSSTATSNISFGLLAGSGLATSREILLTGKLNITITRIARSVIGGLYGVHNWGSGYDDIRSTIDVDVTNNNPSSTVVFGGIVGTQNSTSSLTRINIADQKLKFTQGSTSQTINMGGIAGSGRMYLNQISISNTLLLVTGSSTSTLTTNLGGMIGTTDDSRTVSTISNSYVAARIQYPTSGTRYVSPIIGNVRETATYSNIHILMSATRECADTGSVSCFNLSNASKLADNGITPAFIAGTLNWSTSAWDTSKMWSSGTRSTGPILSFFATDVKYELSLAKRIYNATTLANLISDVQANVVIKRYGTVITNSNEKTISLSNMPSSVSSQVTYTISVTVNDPDTTSTGTVFKTGSFEIYNSTSTVNYSSSLQKTTYEYEGIDEDVIKNDVKAQVRYTRDSKTCTSCSVVVDFADKVSSGMNTATVKLLDYGTEVRSTQYTIEIVILYKVEWKQSSITLSKEFTDVELESAIFGATKFFAGNQTFNNFTVKISKYTITKDNIMKVRYTIIVDEQEVYLVNDTINVVFANN